MTEINLPEAEALPAAMVTRQQWLCWRPEPRDGKVTKVPIDPTTGRYASSTDSTTWTDFATARSYAKQQRIGIGFVFTDDDSLVGVDLDSCRDPETGTLTDWARDIITRLDSYTEVSPSGTGVHVIVNGTLPEGRNRHGDVELYETARFFTVTGDQLDLTPQTTARRSNALTAVHEEYVADDDDPASQRDVAADPSPADDDSDQRRGNDLDDTALLAKAKGAANGQKFTRLYRGDTVGYASQSEADMALCSILAFWTGGDATQIDRLFRDSGLIRGKWDEVHFSDGATYGERTIERAIARTQEFYGKEEPWTLFPDGETSPQSTEIGPDESDTQESLTRNTIEALDAEIRRLEAENETLAAELALEREQRQALEAKHKEKQSTGIFGWFR